MNPTFAGAWLFSRRTDLLVFGGSAVLSLFAIALGKALGILHGGSPEWAWIVGVLLVDVAHVWATGFRVWFDPAELRRRPLPYVLVPGLCYVFGVMLHAQGKETFWRVLAYAAVIHFIRQQYGWVVLYRARAGEVDRWGAFLDKATIYAATIYPVIHWHTHLPRRFHWFLRGDFVALPEMAERVAFPVYVALLLAYAIRALVHRPINVGKHLLVGSTALLWWLGIVALNSDYAFTVTNVLIHGIPYVAIVYLYQRAKLPAKGALPPVRLPLFLFVLWCLAFAEEFLWDRAIWHDREWLFGQGWELGRHATWLVPLLTLPQVTHYVLDGFVWRRQKNPHVSKTVGLIVPKGVIP